MLVADCMREWECAAGSQACDSSDRAAMKPLEGDLGTALYAALSSPAVCDHFLAQPQLAKQFHSCITGLQGSLLAHLTAGACLAQLCLLELRKGQAKGMGKGMAERQFSYCACVQQLRTFDAVWQGFRTAAAVRPHL